MKKLHKLLTFMTEVLSHRNQITDLPYKSMDWFLYDKDLRHERIIKKYTKINNDLFKKVTPYSEKITHKTKLLHQITKLLHQIYFFCHQIGKNFTRNIKIFTPN